MRHYQIFHTGRSDRGYMWGDVLLSKGKELELSQGFLEEAEDGEVWLEWEKRVLYMDVLLCKGKQRQMLGFRFTRPVQREEIRRVFLEMISKGEAEKYVDRIVSLVAIAFLGRR